MGRAEGLRDDMLAKVEALVADLATAKGMLHHEGMKTRSQESEG